MSKVIPKIPNRKYRRIFKDVKKANHAVNMLLNGYSFKEISRFFGIDHTSVMAFKKRCEKTGIIFPSYERGYIKNMSKIIEFFVKPISKPRPDSFPKEKSYAEYLKEDNERKKEAEDQLMTKAKKTIQELHKWRKENKLHTTTRF